MKLIEPMEPIIQDKIFDSPDFTYQLKWDGVRMLAYINNNSVQLINKKLHNRTIQYPELQLLSSFLNHNNIILDGEIIAFKDSRPNFPAVMRRDNAISNQSIKRLLQEVPINYVVFDLLWDGDEDLRGLPLTQRQNKLNELLKPQAMIYLIEDFPSGSNLFTAVKEANLEGVVAKRKDSHYLAGKKHRDWFKIKYRRRQACIVGGYTLKNNIANSLLLGVYFNNFLHYVGKVGNGMSANEWQQLTKVLKYLQTDKSPFNFATTKSNQEIFFIKPHLVIEVEFAEWTDNMHLRSPVLKGFLKKLPEECQV
ncbi:MAG: non-homologous end-joining DNA ligase [Syntrophomonadaceae bacterium]|jgi:bifunctional non-homologous end joining protein LigD